MNNTAFRVILAAAIMAIVFGITIVMGRLSGVTKPVTMPQTSITTLPRVIGERKGEDEEVDDRMFHAIQAAEVVSRKYIDPAATSAISAHVASYSDYWRLTPHSPMVCYPANGFTKGEETIVELPGCDGARVKMVYFEKDKKPHIVVFWFQFGDKIFVDDEGLSVAQRAYRSSKTWPAIVKVLLSTAHPRPKQFEPEMLTFAGQIREWSRKLQTDPPLPAEAKDPAAETPAKEEEAKDAGTRPNATPAEDDAAAKESGE